jgi:hypothetical protein
MVTATYCCSIQIRNLLFGFFCCVSFICKGYLAVQIESPEKKTLMEVFGETQYAPQRNKLAGTPYVDNLPYLEKALTQVAVNRSNSFGRDWSHQRAKMFSFLKKVFGTKLTPKEMNMLLGGVTLRAYMRMHGNCMPPSVPSPKIVASAPVSIRRVPRLAP